MARLFSNNFRPPHQNKKLYLPRTIHILSTRPAKSLDKHMSRLLCRNTWGIKSGNLHPGHTKQSILSSPRQNIQCNNFRGFEGKTIL